MIFIWSYLLVCYWWWIAKKTTCLSILTLTVRTSNISPGPKIHLRLLPLATGQLLLSVIRRPGIWSIIATDSISQMFYNYRHNCFIIIISDYHLSINSQLLWPARCPGIWSIVTDSISQVTRSKSGEIRNQSLQALCFAMISRTYCCQIVDTNNSENNFNSLQYMSVHFQAGYK